MDREKERRKEITVKAKERSSRHGKIVKEGGQARQVERKGKDGVR